MDLKLLSDNQLIQLFKNSNLDKELKSKVINEIDRRALELNDNLQKKLDLTTKWKIIFTCYFFYKYHVNESSKFIVSGNKEAYKEYWKYFNIGMFFYIIVFLLIIRYVIKPLI